jgi:hypothetical protein
MPVRFEIAETPRQSPPVFLLPDVPENQKNRTDLITLLEDSSSSHQNSHGVSHQYPREKPTQ